MRIVYKYGGSSVSDTDKILNIAKYLVDMKSKGNEIIVVVSAMGNTTDMLINLAKNISSNPNKRELDRLMSTGEQQTIALLSIAIHSLGYDAISLSGEQAGIKTSGNHTKNIISSIDANIIEKYLKDNKIVIVAGFQGINENGDVTTLGRGGSDTSAVALAAVLNAKCEIYTDVEGIYTIDPRIYNKAKKIDKISYEEMMVLSNLGAGVMETRSIELANKYGVEVYVAKTLSNIEGTLITYKENIMEKKIITGISVDKNVMMINIENIPTYAKNIYPIFKEFENKSINISLISQNDVTNENGSIAFVVSKNDKNVLDEAFVNIKNKMPMIQETITENIAMLSVVGIGMNSNVNIATRIFKILSKNNISFHQISTSEISISIVVNESLLEELACLLAEEFEI